jgi:hypothetical protein
MRDSHDDRGRIVVNVIGSLDGKDTRRSLENVNVIKGE